jgi:GNAT superfamily N-acetyltransferase
MSDHPSFRRVGQEPAARARAHAIDVRIVAYDPVRPDHRTAFRDLNLAWIETHFVVEPRDRHELDDPEGHILALGGAVFMAEADGPMGVDVLGTCALLLEPDGAGELAKMAVRESARGRGVGRALGEKAIAVARARGMPRVDLLSNRKLAPAIALYRALGFIEAPLPATEYARANIKMTLHLSA